MSKPVRRPATVAAQADGFVGEALGELVPGIRPSTTFVRRPDYSLTHPQHEYSRDENPTYGPVEQVLARLEGGAASMVFASGMAAMTSVIQALEPGAHVLAQDLMYYGTIRWLRRFAARRGIEVGFFDAGAPGALEAALAPGRTRLVWIETPANPTWDVVDIAAVARAAHDAGAVVAVDSTAASPVLTRPLEHGADLVVHSATKYLNGHSDLTAGAVITGEAGPLWEAIRLERRAGPVLGAFEAWLLLRGMRTLFVRVRHASAAAMAIAERFDGDSRLDRVLYPGLAGHPGHDVARRQMDGGFGGMLSLCVKGGAEAALAVAARLEVFARATSLGGVESLAEHRASIEGPDSRCPPNLLRLSVGLEDVDDLVEDIDQALEAVA